MQFFAFFSTTTQRNLKNICFVSKGLPKFYFYFRTSENESQKRGMKSLTSTFKVRSCDQSQNTNADLDKLPMMQI